MPDFAGDAEKSRAAKNALRNRLLAARSSRTPLDRLTAAASVQAVLLSLVRAQHPTTVAGYVPVGSEPGGADLPDVLLRALPPGGRLLLPVLLDDGDLDWVPYSGTVIRGSRGLLEPSGARLGVEAVRTAALVVVPALAVSSTGIRLGRGGGSYDRVLARLTPHGTVPPPHGTVRPPHGTVPPPHDTGSTPPPDAVLTVALLYDGELVDALPAEPHDQPVGAAITPTGGLALSRATEWTN